MLHHARVPRRFGTRALSVSEMLLRIGESITVVIRKGTVPFSSNENRDSPPLIHSPMLICLVAVLLLRAGTAVSQQPNHTRAVVQSEQPARQPHSDPLPDFAVARLGTLRLRPGGPVVGLAFSRDGKTLASAGGLWGIGTNELRLWNAADGCLLRSQSLDYELDVYSDRQGLSFAADGTAVAQGCSERVFFWDLKGKGAVRWLGGDNRCVCCLTASPDGKSILWGDRARDFTDPKIVVFDVATGRTVQELRVPNSVKDIRFSPKGKVIATIDRDGIVNLRDVPPGIGSRCLRHEAEVPRTPAGTPFSREDWTIFVNLGSGTSHIAFSPDGTTLATADRKGISLWNVLSGKETLRIPGKFWASDLAFTPSGKLLAAMSNGEDHNLRLWDATTGNEVSKQKTAPGDTLLAFSPDGQLLATAGHSGSLTLRRFPENKNVLDLPGHTDEVAFVRFLGGGRSLVSRDCHDKVILWDIPTRKPIWEFSVSGWAEATAVSPQRNIMAIGVHDRGLEIWDLAQKKCEKTIKMRNDRARLLLEFSPDGKYLAGGDVVGFVEVWDVRSGQTIHTWDARAVDYTQEILSLAWSPDGKTLLAAARSGLRWLDVPGGKVVRESPGSDETDFRFATFSPNGRMVAELAGGSCTLRDAVSGRELSKIDGNLDGMVAFSPDGTILAGSDTRPCVIRLIDVSTGRERAR
jgi:WD40 repeat protein